MTSRKKGVEQDKAQQDARIWQLASDLARVFNRYLTHREGLAGAMVG
ncbi:hypothetical protein [Psychrobacter sp. KH172YL61]|nr:hypothetical protein [Psychrobacter sp. KH172YL61]